MATAAALDRSLPSHRVLGLLDAHTHIQDARPDPLCGTEGLLGAVVLATSSKDWDSVLALCEDATKRRPAFRLLPGLGVHPWYVSEAEGFSLASWPSTVSALRDALVRAGPTVSVGEIGLDKAPRAVEKNPWETQLAVFRSQFSLAAELKRPVSLHCVRCYDDMLKELEPFSATTNGAANTVPAVLFHSFGGAPHVLQRLSQLFPQPKDHAWALEPCFTLLDERAQASNAGAGGKKQGAKAKGKSAGNAESEGHEVLSVPITRVLISFQGGIVAPVVEAFSEAFPSLSAPGDAAAAKGAGASKQTMSVLASLPYHQLCFETDAPYQPFAADYQHPTYRTEWRDKVVAAIARAGIDVGAGTGVRSAASTVFSSAASAAEGDRITCCGPADGAAEEDFSPPPQTPSRVLDVIVAAATWRVLKRCKPPTTTTTTTPSTDKKAESPQEKESKWWPPVELVAKEAVLLVRASAWNVLECFGGSADPGARFFSPEEPLS